MTLQCTVPLDEHGAVSKSSEGLAGCSFKLLDTLVNVVDNPHPSTPATVRCLQDHRASVLRNELKSLLGSVNGLVSAGDDGEAGRDGRLPCGHLVPHLGHHRPLWSDEANAGLDAGVCKVRTFREESIAGVDGVNIVLLANTNENPRHGDEVPV